MTLPTTGALTMAAINAEFGLGNDLGIYRGVRWAKDNGTTGTFTNTNLGFDQFYGTKLGPMVTNPISFDGQTYEIDGTNDTVVRLTLTSDGKWNVYDIADTPFYSGDWVSPTTTSGNFTWMPGHYARFTRVSGVLSGIGTGSGSSTPTTGWLSIDSGQTASVNVIANAITGTKIYTAQYLVQVSPSSVGSIITGSGTVTLRAVAYGGSPP